MFSVRSLLLVLASVTLVAGCKKKSSAPAAGGSAAATPVTGSPSPNAAPPPAAAPSTQLALANGTIFYKLADGSVKVSGYPGLFAGVEPPDNPAPLVVPDLAGTARLASATSDDNMCVAMKDGSVKCWGDNTVGQLGTGAKGAESKKPVAIGGVSGVADVGIAGGRACALISDGSVTCWGSNQWHKAAPVDGDIIKPTAVAGVTGVQKLAVANDTVCALGKDGSVKCWGLECGAAGANDCEKPYTLANFAGALDVNAGMNFMCVTAKDSSVSCWGHSNEYGQFGDGTTELTDGKFTTVKGLTGPRTIAGGAFHACALMKDATVQCWGDNEYGQLGDGTVPTADPKFRATPAPVKGLTDVVSLTCDDGGCCAQVKDNSVKCWGQNENSSMFGSASSAQNSPTPITVTVQ